MRKFKYLLFCLFQYLFASAQENQLPSFITDSLDTYIERGMEDWQIPGLAIAVVKNNEAVYIKGFGVRDLDTRQAVNENTLFMIGSNTKAFTATALALLQERTDFKLTDKVQTWMPEFRLKDELATREVNTIDLLSHRIGFNTFQGDFTYWTSTLTRKDVIQKMGVLNLPKGFRGTWGYSNAAFVTAGELILES